MRIIIMIVTTLVFFVGCSSNNLALNNSYTFNRVIKYPIVLDKNFESMFRTIKTKVSFVLGKEEKINANIITKVAIRQIKDKTKVIGEFKINSKSVNDSINFDYSHKCKNGKIVNLDFDVNMESNELKTEILEKMKTSSYSCIMNKSVKTGDIILSLTEAFNNKDIKEVLGNKSVDLDFIVKGLGTYKNKDVIISELNVNKVFNTDDKRLKLNFIANGVLLFTPPFKTNMLFETSFKINILYDNRIVGVFKTDTHEFNK